MQLVGQKVKHRNPVKGDGIVTAFDESAVYVQFSNDEAAKPYAVKTIIDGIITFYSKDAQTEAEHIIRSSKEYQDSQRPKPVMTVKATPEPTPFAIRETKVHVKKERSVRVSSSGTVRSEVRRFGTKNTFCDAFIEELKREIAFVKKNGGKRFNLFFGELVSSSSDSHIYKFETDTDFSAPDGTRIKIFLRDKEYTAQAVHYENYALTVACDQTLGTTKSIEATYEIDSTFLTQKLIDKLEEAKERSNIEIAEDLVTSGLSKVSRIGEIASGQDVAVKKSLEQDITFVWGPPGTGKTETLANIAIEHMKQGERVLMLSYSNVSVDGATLRIFKKMNEPKAGVVIRSGYAKMEELLNHPYLTDEKCVSFLNHELLDSFNECRRKRKAYNEAGPGYNRLKTEEKAILDKIKRSKFELVHKAGFVATTIAKACADTTLFDCKYDTVIFDEASMAYIPQIFVAATFASKSFICMGDFKQLPPIVQQKNSVLEHDIFEYCGITNAVERGYNHDWLCLLSTQYRMHPYIADFSGKQMYHNHIKSAPGMEEKRSEYQGVLPEFKSPISLADLSGIMTPCTSQKKSGSRINVVSALISFSMAIKALEHNKHLNFNVGIITPYNAQSRLIHNMIRDYENKNKDIFQRISCATVHQFQGSECDLIIYDAVDSFPKKAGKLLTDMRNNTANRLFNVALTRARSKFLCVADVSNFRRDEMSSLVFGRLLERNKLNGNYLKGNDLLHAADADDSIIDFFHGDEPYETFYEDLRKAEQSIRVEIPKTPLDNDNLRKLLTLLNLGVAAKLDVVIRVQSKRDLPQCFRDLKLPIVENSEVLNPLVVIDNKITWYGLPVTDITALEADCGVKIISRPFIRFIGKYTARMIISSLEMDDRLDQYTAEDGSSEQVVSIDTLASYIATNYVCDKCGKSQVMRKNSSGKFFIACSDRNCRQTDKITTELVEDYISSKGEYGIRCPKCGSSLEAKISYKGIYVHCSTDDYYSAHKFGLDEI